MYFRSLCLFTGSGPMCSSNASNFSSTSYGDPVMLSCGVTYADHQSSLIKPIMTMILDGKVIAKGQVQPTLTGQMVYVATSTIVINCSDYQFFQCQLTFAAPELTVAYIAKNAPDFNTSCFLPRESHKNTIK